MYFTTFLVASLSALGVIAAPEPKRPCPCTLSDLCEDYDPCVTSDFGVTTTTLFLTLTTTSTHTCTATHKVTTTTAKTTTTSSAPPLTAPTSAYGLISARSASPVHLLPWSAAGQRFYLGGGTSSYCPDSVQNAKACPPGNVTAFLGTCAMDVIVPGGQSIYVTLEGEIGYTQAHSIYRPAGAKDCPFAYSKPAGSSFGYITLEPTQAFGATGFMACPTDSGFYQVFANLQNATVPKGNVSACLGFDALATDYNGFAAWQYT